MKCRLALDENPDICPPILLSVEKSMIKRQPLKHKTLKMTTKPI